MKPISNIYIYIYIKVDIVFNYIVLGDFLTNVLVPDMYETGVLQTCIKTCSWKSEMTATLSNMMPTGIDYFWGLFMQ